MEQSLTIGGTITHNPWNNHSQSVEQSLTIGEIITHNRWNNHSQSAALRAGSSSRRRRARAHLPRPSARCPSASRASRSRTCQRSRAGTAPRRGGTRGSATPGRS